MGNSRKITVKRDRQRGGEISNGVISLVIGNVQKTEQRETHKQSGLKKSFGLQAKLILYTEQLCKEINKVNIDRELQKNKKKHQKIMHRTRASCPFLLFRFFPFVIGSQINVMYSCKVDKIQ